MAECCPPGSHPALVADADRKVNGTERLLGDLNMYISQPAEATDKAVICIYDVHGLNSGRLKGVCDSLAEAGYLAVMPDFYGNAVDIDDVGGFGSEGGKTLLLANSWEKLEKEISAVHTMLTTEFNIKKTGAIGFCWGCYVVFKASGTGKIDAGVNFHPSIRVAKLLYGETEEEVTQAVKCPQYLAPCSNDPDNLKEGGELVGILRGKGLQCDVHHFADMKHGFMSRGDTKTDATIARDVQIGLEETLAFFGKQL